MVNRKLTLRLTDPATGDKFIAVVGHKVEKFATKYHARNFVYHLYRVGRQQPNSKTVNNSLWVFGRDGNINASSADARIASGATSLTKYENAFLTNWRGLRNEICYFVRDDDTGAQISDVQLQRLYGLLCHHAGLDCTGNIAVTHHDEAQPIHVHRVFASGGKSLHSLLVSDGLLS